MRKIESYGSPEQVKERILQLREEGVSEDAITVVAKEGLHDTAFNDYDVNFKKAEGSAWDKFVSFFTGEDSEDRVVEDLDLSKDEEAQYKRELEDGGILLYVNDYESRDGNLKHTPQATGGAYYANTDNPEEDRMRDKENRFASDADGDIHRDPLTDRANNAARDEGAYGQDSMAEKENAYNDRVNGNNKTNNNVDEETLELQEERLNVDKQQVRAGEVDVSKHVETDHQEFDVPVEREEVTVERREVGDRPADGNFNNNDEIHIPVNEERVNVTKENVVDEEVVIKKETVQDTEHVSEDVRREEVDVEESYQDRDRNKGVNNNEFGANSNRNTDYTDTAFERESKSNRLQDDEIVDDARNRDNDRF